LKSGVANALATTTVLTMGNGADSGNTFDLNGNNQTLAGVTVGSSSSSQTITNGASGTGTSTLTVNGSGTGYSFGGVIQDGATAHTALTQSGTNTFTLTGADLYTGKTTVSSGNLTIGSTGSLASGSAVSVNGGTLNVLGKVGGSVGVASGATLSGNGNGTTTGVVGALTVAGGGIINTQDNTIGTLGGSTLTLATGGGNAVLDLDISTGHTADLLTFTGAATLNNVFTVNVDALLSAGTGTYTIATASGGGLLASDFTAGSLTGLSGDTMTFQQNGNSVQLVISATGAESTSYYFTGAGSNVFATAGNYTDAASSGNVHSTALSSTSNVFLNANTATNTPDTLNTSASINSLNFVTAGTSLAGTGTVTLAATGTAGITDSAGVAGQTETVAPAVVLGSNQSWAATANSTLNVTGAISGPQSLAVTGNGTYKFAGSNTFQGLTVGTGSDTPTLYLTNGTSGSATGTTTLRVNAGATLAGNGTSSGTSFNISGTGTATGARANVLVGLTSAIDTTVGNKLSLIGSTGTSTIADANLTFNLSATSTASNQLSVGATNIGFGTDNKSVLFSLNLQGEPAIVPNGTLYTLIAGIGSTSTGVGSSTGQYTGLTLGNSTTVGGVTETIITGNNLQVAFGSSVDTSYYGNGSYLVLYQSAGVDDIDVVVVPEPGTWALMLGGLGLLVVVQRARRKNS
jgi:fibronectin-binding autotransporter adhesin